MSPANLLGSLVAAATALALTVGGASAQTPIGPDHQFAGAVNGSTTDATIYMVCAGPVLQDQLGHPQAGQSVQVVADTGKGFTGSAANSIVASIGPSPDLSLTFTFTEYGVPQDIPTTAVLPCSGTGIAIFDPQPSSSTSTSATVRLQFVNIAV